MTEFIGGPPRVALITGATGVIGFAIAKGIALNHNYEVVLVARDEIKANNAVSKIKGITGNEHVRFDLADLSRKSAVEELARRWEGPLHVLVNNAAACPRKRQETPQGIEYQFATNVLGYYWMISNFTQQLIQSAPACVVNIASYWAGNLDMDDLEFKKRSYNNNTAYRQSKQADRMLTVAFSERVKTYGIAVNACHPGDVRSKLSNDLGFGGYETADAGARTPVWLATSTAGFNQTGKYFENLRPVHCRFGEDSAAVEELYQICDKY